MYLFNQFLDEELKLTLKYHKRMSSKIWRQGKLIPELRDILLPLAKQFAIFSGVPSSKIRDIVLTGSIANFNYTKYSDIDVHIMTNASGISDEALYSKKVEWTNMHKGLNYKNLPLEFYIHDTSVDPLPSDQGVYSILKNTWVKTPARLDDVSILTDPLLIKKLEHYIEYIKTGLLKKGTVDTISAFKQKLWRMRSSGLSREGEFSMENVIYKDLRNRGLIEKINNRLSQLKQKESSR